MTRAAWQFIGLAYALAWGLALAFFGFGGRWNTPPAFVVAVLYMFTPALTVVLLQRRRGEPVRSLGLSLRPNRWWLAASLVPLTVALLAFGIALLFPQVHFAPDLAGLYQRMAATLTPEQLAQAREQTARLPLHPFWLAIIAAIGSGLTVNAVAGFGEELGWRGFLQRELEPLGLWRSSLLVGVVWGVWHLPLILQGHNYPQHPLAGAGMMVVFCVLLSPLMAFVRAKAGSVVAAAIFHGTLNASVGVALMLLAGGDDLLVGMTGLAGLLGLVLLNAALFGWTRLRPTTAASPLPETTGAACVGKCHVSGSDPMP